MISTVSVGDGQLVVSAGLTQPLDRHGGVEAGVERRGRAQAGGPRALVRLAVTHQGFAASSLLLERAGIDAGHLGSPGDELGAGIVVGNLAFDENRAAFVGAGFADRIGQFACGGCGQP